MRLITVDLMNVGLMLMAAAAAFLVPFETFLLAYAVLGPLHYLTQIAWLHRRQYFTQRRRDWWPLAAAAVMVTGLLLLAPQRTGLVTALVLACLAWSLLATATRDRGLRAAGGLVAAGTVLFLHAEPSLAVFATFWLPTLVHVFLCTGLFVLHGALKARSASGGAALLVFLACGAATLWLPVGLQGYVASGYVHDVYAGTMGHMHASLLRSAGLVAVPAGVSASGLFAPFDSLAAMLADEVSVQFGRFVAFAYTYHYLNWFSKTSVIRWHHVPRPWLVAAVVGWLASVALYAADFELGLRWLFLLSLLHVLLELPLDWQTVLSIPRALVARRAA
jgi:hypothetical protein